MKIEPIGNGLSDERTFVLRYRDQSLTLGERQVFEALIEAGSRHQGRLDGKARRPDPHELNWSRSSSVTDSGTSRQRPRLSKPPAGWPISASSTFGGATRFVARTRWTRDFPPAARDCDGLVVLRGHADEGGGEYRCPTCERIVYPDADGKERLETLTILLRPQGIEKFLIKHCGKDARGRQFQDGVLTLPIEGVNACICLPEFCSNSLLLRRSAALSQTTIYVTVEPDAQRRMLQDVGIAHVALPRILTGEVDLCSMLRDRVRNGPLACSNVDVPVYGFGVTVIGPRVEPVPLSRRFTIKLNSEGFWVDDLLVVKAERKTAILILRGLVHRFAEDVGAGSEVAAMSVDDIADAVERAGDPESDEKRDPTPSAGRSTVSATRLHETIRKTTGKPIGEYDIIETVSRSGAGRAQRGIGSIRRRSRWRLRHPERSPVQKIFALSDRAW